MEIKHCRFCHRSFQGFSNLCPPCLDELDRKYIAVRNHLDVHPESNIKEISQATGVDEKSILFLVREGRLILRATTTALKCLKCGLPLAAGKYCDACRAVIMQSLGTAQSAPSPGVKASGIKPGQSKTQMYTRKKD